MDFLTTFWHFLSISAPFLMLGLVASGLLQALVSAQQIKKNLAGSGIGPILKASLIGIPLPLCSCGVIPAGVALKKQGASNGAVSAFVIATPETGIDSIALTYALMDLPMAIFRPLVAGLSAFLAGIGQEIFNPPGSPLARGQHAPPSPTPACHCVHDAEVPRSLRVRFQQGGRFVLWDLLPDIAPWLLVGLVAGTLITHFLPLGLLPQFNGFWGKLVMIAIGLPLYICASSATPVAASLVMKGLSPGTALIFLLVGPATNITNILVLQKYLGKRGVLINLLSVALVAFGFSYVIDNLYGWMNWHLTFVGTIAQVHHSSNLLWEGLQLFLNLLFCSLLLWGLALRWRKKDADHEHPEGCCP